MASRPTTIPQLDTNKTNRSIPAPSKVTDGYVLNDLFTSPNANYLHGWAGDWLEWLQERTEDGVTPGTDFTLRGLDALTVTGDGGVLTLKGGDGGGTSGDGGDILLLPGDVTSGTKGAVGIGTPSPDNTLHVHKASSGASGVGSSFAPLVVENSNYCYMQLLAPATAGCGILFGDGTSGDDDVGRILYSHISNSLEFSVNTATAVTIDSARQVGIGTNGPDSPLHVHLGSAGTVSAGANTPLTIENNTACWFQLLAPNTTSCGILFGDNDQINTGFINYDHSPESMQFAVGAGNVRMTLNATGLGIGVAAPGTPLDVLAATADAILATAAGSGIGVTGVGSGTGSGIKGTSGSASGTGPGVDGYGDATYTSIGVRGTGGGVNGTGVYGDGKGAGHGVYGFGATGGTGNGVYGSSQNATGAGVRGLGFGAGTGVRGVAGNTAGALGVEGTGGTGGGIGVSGTGTTSYSGVKGTGGPTNGVGVEAIGTGSGTGLLSTGGTTGKGAIITGGSSGGNALEAVAYSGSTAVLADSTGGTGYAIVALAATSTPARAALKLIPQAIAPSVAEVGAMYVNSGTGKLHCYDGVTWSQCN